MKQIQAGRPFSSRRPALASRAVRDEFMDLYGQPTTGFKEVPGRPTAIVVGVGFWDLCTGAHIPRGAASNCIELHPLLDIEPIP